MKKKVVHHRKSSRKSHRHSQIPVFSFQRIIVVGGLALFLLVVGMGYKNPDTRSVLGASIARPLFSKATVSLPSIPGVTAYNIYFKASSDNSFVYAQRNVPTNIQWSTINYLKRGTEYVYKISALKNGVEFWTSPIAQMSTQPM